MKRLYFLLSPLMYIMAVISSALSHCKLWRVTAGGHWEKWYVSLAAGCDITQWPTVWIRVDRCSEKTGDRPVAGCRAWPVCEEQGQCVTPPYSLRCPSCSRNLMVADGVFRSEGADGSECYSCPCGEWAECAEHVQLEMGVSV